MTQRAFYDVRITAGIRQSHQGPDDPRGQNDGFGFPEMRKLLGHDQRIRQHKNAQRHVSDRGGGEVQRR